MNGTTSHVEETIKSVTVEIGQLQDLLTGLHGFAKRQQPGLAGINGQEPIADSRGATAKVRRAGPAKGGVTRRVAKDGGRKVEGMDPRRVNALRLLAGMPQPFSAKEIEKVFKVVNGSGVINRYKVFLTRLGHGQYERNGKFPVLVPQTDGAHGVTRPTSGTDTPGNGKKTRGVLEVELSKALQQRDHARENGREQMVEIFQQDVDRIEKELRKAK